MTIQRGSGDPAGRRIARRRNRVLAEASRAGRAFGALLRRAGLDAPELAPLLARLADEEERELMRGAGRLESRKRFKHRSGQPLQEPRAADLLFLDESGTAHPQAPEPCFVLGGIAMAEEEADAYRARADALKTEFFGRTDITFHEPHVRNHAGWFFVGGSLDRQRELCAAIDRLVAESVFTLFGVAIRKDALADFIRTEADPYLPPSLYAIAIQLLLERYVDYLATRGDNPMGRVTFESVGPREDAEHQREYADLLLHGTQWVPDSAFRNWLITGCEFTRKQGSDPMELADMAARDLFEWTRGGCGEFTPRRWHVWQPKIHVRDDEAMGKFGIKVFPDSDIRDRIEEHRRRVAGEGN